MSVLDKYCDKEPGQARVSEACEGQCQGVKWIYGPWSPCTTTCGGGSQQVRLVQGGLSYGPWSPSTTCGVSSSHVRLAQGGLAMAF